MRRGNSFPEQGKVEDDRRVIRSWKHPRSVRVAFFLAFVISLTLSLLSAVGLVGKPEVVVADVLVPVFFLFVGALFLALTESSIAMTSQVIRVRNFCRWRVISLDDVISVSPGILRRSYQVLIEWIYSQPRLAEIKYCKLVQTPDSSRRDF